MRSFCATVYLHTRSTTCVHHMDFRGSVGIRKWMKYVLDWPLGYYFVDEFYVCDFV